MVIGAAQAWLLPAIPACAFIILAFFRNWLPRKGDWLSILAILASFVLFFAVLADFLAGGSRPVAAGFRWLSLGSYGLRIGFYVDQIAIVMLAVVTIVALMVNIYSTGYMRDHAGNEEPRYGWFFAVLSLFAASMLTLVLADNFLLLYAMWEMVGICSFLLIGFYYERRSAVEAAKKAFVTTRFGDVGFLIGIILLWRATGTFDIQQTIRAATSGHLSGAYLTVAVLFLFAGAVGKSAQIPLHVWLPDAMEGPTPVSALIHAATMVVAGIYMVSRTLPMFLAAPGAATVVLVVGIATALMAATIAIVMTDIKKVVAYSTISNLGMMMAALGAGALSGAMFHLMTHAFFKALLFLGCGAVIHQTEKQELGSLGGLWRKMPVTAVCFIIAALANAGIPPLAGFWSKDDMFLDILRNTNITYLILALLWVALSAIYTTRLVVLTFFGKPRDAHAYEHASDPKLSMTGPLVILAVLAALAGLVAFEGVGRLLGFPGGFTQFLYLHEPEALTINPALAVGSSLTAILAVIFGFWVWAGRTNRSRQLAAWMPDGYRLVTNKLYFDDLYQAIINRVVLGIAGTVAWFDRNIVNNTGVNGTAALTVWTGFKLKYQETGKLPNYALAIILGVVVLVVIAFSTRA
ncbi:MAG TPA: NADH-quinone oxidoreductase subunit L [Dehalococcoidia bacterium]|nr:NADH-quinone oxidoreductase subunit L [Dehalococcoidia bacterium]